jgi:hypothetical protein
MQMDSKRDILNEKNGLSALNKFYITELNKRKFNNVIFFLKFVISVMGDQFLALGTRKLSHASGCVPFMYTFP